MHSYHTPLNDTEYKLTFTAISEGGQNASFSLSFRFIHPYENYENYENQPPEFIIQPPDLVFEVELNRDQSLILTRFLPLAFDQENNTIQLLSENLYAEFHCDCVKLKTDLNSKGQMITWIELTAKYMVS